MTITFVLIYVVSFIVLFFLSIKTITEMEAKALADTINAIDQKSNEELRATAENAKAYLLKNKTWEINAQKVYEFLKNEFEK